MKTESEFKTREEYLTFASEWLLDDLIIPECGVAKPPYRVSVGWSRGVRNTSKVLGSCHPRSHSADGHNEIFISPAIAETTDALATLLHELLHAVDDCKSRHRGAFKRMALAVGLNAPMTATTPNAELREMLDWFIAEHGPMPAAPIDDAKRPRQGTRMIKFECAGLCGFSARTTAKHIRNFTRENAQCPCCGAPLSTPELNNEEYNMNNVMFNTNKFSKMTMKEKAATRAHLRAAGLDPSDLTPREFVDYAKKHGLLSGDDTVERTPTASPEKPKHQGPTMEIDEIDEDADVPADAPADDNDTLTPDDETEGEGDDEDEGEGEGDDEDEGEGDDEDEGEGDDEDDDDESESPEIPEPTNPMDAMIDERIAAHLAKHIHDDEHRITATQTRSEFAKLRKQIKSFKQTGPAPAPIKVIKIADRKPVEIDGMTHAMFETCLKISADRDLNLYMVGKAGSGKTTLAMQMAKAFDLEFYMTGKVDDIFTLMGFENAAGKYQPTAFYEAFNNGGVFLADEMDRYAPEAFVGINAAAANRVCSFPDGQGVRPAHPDFIFIGAGNTYGTGNDRVYTAAQAMDQSTMDRFVPVEIAYDEEVERAVSLAHNSAAGPWVDWVQKVRAKALTAMPDLLVTPRASIQGAKLLAKGFTLGEVKTMTVFAGLDADARTMLDNV